MPTRIRRIFVMASLLCVGFALANFPTYGFAQAVPGRSVDSASLKPEPVVQDVPTRDVGTVAFSPNGILMATAAEDGTVKVWDLRSRMVVTSFSVEAGRCSQVAFSADSKTLALAPERRDVFLLDLSTRKHLQILDSGEQPSMAFSPDNTTLAIGDAWEQHLQQDPDARLRKALAMTYTEGDARKTERVAHEIERALASGADPNVQNSSGTSALIFLAGAGDLKAVKDLVRRGAKLDLSERYGRTALLCAAAAHRPKIVQFLLDAGADFKDLQGYSLLPLQGHPDALGDALVAALDLPTGVGINRTTSAEEKAAQKLWQKFDWNDTALLLLQLGALPNVPDKKGNTALQYANTDVVVQALLAHGADVNVRSKNSVSPILHWAWADQIELVRIALDHGANVNIITERGGSALTSAASNGYDDMARLLLERHADPNLPIAEYGETVLMTAISHGRLNIAKLLLNHGANLEAKDDNGWTALTYAVVRQDREAVRVLLDKGADVRVLTQEGVGLLHLSYENEKEDLYDIALLLKRAGCVK